MVSLLASTIDDNIAQMEKQLLPVSRHRGIRTLPREYLIRTMDLVGSSIEHAPDLFNNTMRAFTDIPPFDAYFKDAKALKRKWWAQQDTVWNGLLPRDAYGKPKASITAFYLSLKNTYTLDAIRNGLKSLTSLEYLSISCNFDYDKITKSEGLEAVTLPNLHTLDVSNIAQQEIEVTHTNDDDVLISEPLRRVVGILTMPNLSHISANLVSYALPQSDIPTLHSILDLSHRTYSKVKSVEIRDLQLQCPWAHAPLDLEPLLSSCPALTALSLHFCHRIFLSIDSSNNNTSLLSSLTLEFKGGYDPKFLEEDVIQYIIPDVKKLQQRSALKEIIVKSKDAEIVQAFRDIHPSTRWVTDRSILE